MSRKFNEVFGKLNAFPSLFLITAIKVYRYFLSPLLGPRCRFFPSCSLYGIEAIQKYGPVRGVFKTTVRICKCHPFHKGGVDLP